MNGLKDYFNGLTNEEMQTAVQSAVVAILVFYYKKHLEVNQGKDKKDEFKVEWFPGKWMNFWRTFAPQSIKKFTDKLTKEEKEVNFIVTELIADMLERSIIFNFKRPVKGKPFKANTYTINPDKKEFILKFISKGFKTPEIQEILALEIKKYWELNDAKGDFTQFKSIFED